jgi:hypothetical protein
MEWSVPFIYGRFDGASKKKKMVVGGVYLAVF